MFSIIETFLLGDENEEGSSGNSLSSLRSLRILRAMRSIKVLRMSKILRSMSYIYYIMTVIRKTLQSFIYVGMLLGLLIFIYSLIGMTLYAN